MLKYLLFVIVIFVKYCFSLNPDVTETLDSSPTEHA